MRKKAFTIILIICGLVVADVIWLSSHQEKAIAVILQNPTPQTDLEPNEMHKSTSPLGSWVAEVQADLPEPGQPSPIEFNTELRVASTIKEATHTPIAETRSYGLGFETPAIIRWSPDERYLYYSEQVHADGCVPFTYLSGLWRLDLQSGQVDELLAESRTLSLSPNTRFLIADEREEGLSIRDLETGIRQSMNHYIHGYSGQLGTILWAPDSADVSLNLIRNPCTAEERQSTIELAVYSRSPSTQFTHRISDELPHALPVDYGYERLSRDGPTPSLFIDNVRPDICHPRYEITEMYPKSCARTIEQYQIVQGAAGVVRSQDKLALTLSSGEVFTFTDTTHTGKGRDVSYIQYIPALESHLLHAQHNEGGGFILVQDKTGELKFVSSPPVVAPDGQHFFTMAHIFRGDTAVSIWRIEGETFEHVHNVHLQAQNGDLDPGQARWLNNSRFAIDVEAGRTIFSGSFHITLASTKASAPQVTFHPILPVDEAMPVKDTLILYTTPNNLDAEPIDQFWGLRTAPRIAPIGGPSFETTYARLAYGERFSTQFFYLRPKPSPNGRYLLVIGRVPTDDFQIPGKSYLQLVDLWQGTQRQILSQSALTTWSPDSQRFAYVREKGLFVQEADGTSRARLRFIHKNLQGLYLQWSPDGKWIAVTTHHQGKPETPGTYPSLSDTVWLVPAAGGEPLELATIPTVAIEHVSQELAWSPDSQYLVFQGYVLGLDGRVVKLEDVGIVSQWLPNKPQLLVEGRSGLYVLSPPGEHVAHIADDSVHFMSTAFSRSGDMLAYTQRDEYGEFALFVYNLEDQTNSLISRLAGDIQYMQWSADDSYILYTTGGQRSPIWAVRPLPESTPEVIIEHGLLIEAVPLKTNLSSYAVRIVYSRQEDFNSRGEIGKRTLSLNADTD